MHKHSIEDAPEVINEGKFQHIHVKPEPSKLIEQNNKDEHHGKSIRNSLSNALINADFPTFAEPYKSMNSLSKKKKIQKKKLGQRDGQHQQENMNNGIREGKENNQKYKWQMPSPQFCFLIMWKQGGKKPTEKCRTYYRPIPFFFIVQINLTTSTILLGLILS